MWKGLLPANSPDSVEIQAASIMSGLEGFPVVSSDSLIICLRTLSRLEAKKRFPLLKGKSKA
jgi:hypothetical protein